MLDSQRRLLLVTAQVRGCGFALLGRLLGNKPEAGEEARKRMASYKAGDSKREQFRRYLEKAGVLDTLTKILVELYEEPEKPNNALDFLKQHLGAAGPETPDLEALRLEVAELKQKYEAVLEENKELKAKLAQHEPPTDEKRAE